MRELTQEELQSVSGGMQCTGFIWYVVTGGTICCTANLAHEYTNCYDY